MLRNLGAPIHCFGQLTRAVFLRSSLITPTANAQNLAPSKVNVRRARTSYGVVPKLRAPCAKGHMPALTLLLLFTRAREALMRIDPARSYGVARSREGSRKNSMGLKAAAARVRVAEWRAARAKRR